MTEHVNKTLFWFLVSILCLATTATAAKVWIDLSPDVAKLNHARQLSHEQWMYLRDRLDKIYEEVNKTREELANQRGRENGNRDG